jgi:D-sedoheptulose 7-phosphate isomerase
MSLDSRHVASGPTPAIFESYLRSYIAELDAALNELAPAAIGAVLEAFERARTEHRQFFIFGNGGSAATAAHMACDLGKGTVDYRNPGFTRFRAISLSDNGAHHRARQ